MSNTELNKLCQALNCIKLSVNCFLYQFYVSNKWIYPFDRNKVIYIGKQKLSHKAVSYIEEPYEGNLQVRFCEGHYATPNYKFK